MGIKCSTGARLKAIYFLGNECDNCEVEGWELTVHHIKPRRNGGDHRLINLRVLCRVCHTALESGKSPNGSTFWRNMNSVRISKLIEQGKVVRHYDRWSEELSDMRSKELRFQQRQNERDLLLKIHKGNATWNLAEKLFKAMGYE